MASKGYFLDDTNSPPLTSSMISNLISQWILLVQEFLARVGTIVASAQH